MEREHRRDALVRFVGDRTELRRRPNAQQELHVARLFRVALHRRIDCPVDRLIPGQHTEILRDQGRGLQVDRLHHAPRELSQHGQFIREVLIY